MSIETRNRWLTPLDKEEKSIALGMMSAFGLCLYMIATADDYNVPQTSFAILNAYILGRLIGRRLF